MKGFTRKAIIESSQLLRTTLRLRGFNLPMKRWIEKAKQLLKGPVQEIMRILKVAHKPEREEFTLMLKVCSLGLVALGIYGFIILYLFFVLLVH